MKRSLAMSPTRRRPLVAVLAVLGLAGCEGRNPVRPVPPPTAPATQAPEPPAPAPSAPPTPAPSEPPPPSPTNHPPALTLTGGGSCHPHVNQPCRVEFQADVRDRDGDSFRLEWRGCTSGTGFTELCTIDRPGEHTATVTATDAHGATARASATARGTNLPPVVRIGGPRPPDPAPANTVYPIAGAEPHDPDDYASDNSACPYARVTATGPCHVSFAVCGGVGDVFDFDIRTLAGPGTCVVEASVTDPWGLVGRDTLTFRVRAP
jgi:hypothetical protein